MIALFAAAALAVTPVPPCAAADPAVSDIAVKLVKKRTPDHYVITAKITNVGALAQVPGIVQHAELVQDGKALLQQDVPALGAGITYVLGFAIDRAPALRKTPLPVTVRFVLTRGDAARNNCNTTDDILTKSF
jgi:hypothetical protein